MQGVGHGNHGLEVIAREQIPALSVFSYFVFPLVLIAVLLLLFSKVELK